MEIRLQNLFAAYVAYHAWNYKTVGTIAKVCFVYKLYQYIANMSVNFNWPKKADRAWVEIYCTGMDEQMDPTKTVSIPSDSSTSISPSEVQTVQIAAANLLNVAGDLLNKDPMSQKM